MGKGINKRNRIKRARESSIGNLHAGQFGKGSGVPLPQAPKDTESQHLPKSLQKLMKLKEVTDAKNKEPRRNAPQGNKQQQQGKPLVKGFTKEQGEQGKAERGEGQPSTSGKGGQQQQQGGGSEIEAFMTKRKDGQDVLKGSLFEHEEKKTLKARKKEYLKRKKQKKSGKQVDGSEGQAGAGPSSSGGGGQGQFRHGQGHGQQGQGQQEQGQGQSTQRVRPPPRVLVDKVRFGEVVDRPLEVNLKRKHWAGKVDRSDGQRCTEIFQRQMQQAQQRLTAANTMGGKGQGGQGPPLKKAKTDGHRSGGGSYAKAKSGGGGEEAEALRLQVIEAYRASKKGGSGGVSLDSLKSLVSKNKKLPSTSFTLS